MKMTDYLEGCVYAILRIGVSASDIVCLFVGGVSNLVKKMEEYFRGMSEIIIRKWRKQNEDCLRVCLCCNAHKCERK